MNETRNRGGVVQLVLLGAAALAVAVLLALSLRDSSPPRSAGGPVQLESSASQLAEGATRPAAKGGPEPKAPPAVRGTALRAAAKRAEARQRADAIRREIQARAKAKAATEANQARAAIHTLPQASKLKDRMGLDPGTQRSFHEDFMPLVDECIGMARERGAALTGVLQINMGMVGDEDLGAVVDALSFGETNAALDPELLECVRESGLSLSLDAPPSEGRADVMFTIPFEDAP